MALRCAGSTNHWGWGSRPPVQRQMLPASRSVIDQPARNVASTFSRDGRPSRNCSTARVTIQFTDTSRISACSCRRSWRSSGSRTAVATRLIGRF